MKTFRVKIPFWYYEVFEVEAESEDTAIACALSDMSRWTTEEEIQMGSLDDYLPIAEEVKTARPKKNRSKIVATPRLTEKPC
jgi:hypothetical protein